MHASSWAYTYFRSDSPLGMAILSAQVVCLGNRMAIGTKLPDKKNNEGRGPAT